MKIGVIGYGFVGAAVVHSFRNRAELHICDIDENARNRAIRNLSGVGASESGSNDRPPAIYKDMHLMPPKLDAVFVCVPTPQGDAGVCDSRVLIEVVDDLCVHDVAPTIICKSTAPVSVYNRFPKDRVAYVPEYLRAAHAIEDYMRQQVMVIGANCPELAERVVAVFAESWSNTTPHLTIPREAAVLAKYAHNVSLAAKVAVMNEVYEMASAYGIDWADVRAGFSGTNVAGSHTQVPGPDGKRGFGGACFPKDVQAFLAEVRLLQKELGTVFPPCRTVEAVAGWIQPQEPTDGERK
jgi:UDPglucose 6-dehydrogenase